MCMASGMRVGVLALQGDVSEHLFSLRRAMQELGITGTSLELREPEQLDTIDALLIPGGESSAISMQMKSSGLWDAVRSFAGSGAPVMGTCAGCILLASEVESEGDPDKNDTLALMDITVKRNAFGRQRESFERGLAIKGFDEEFHAIFIRAPSITRTGPNVEILAEIPGGIVMARQKNILALTFHPELVPDTRVHGYFLEMAR